MLANGADVNQANNNGATPLYIASQDGRAEVVSLLLSKEGVDVNAALSDGATPLYIASQKGHTDIVNLLLNATGIEVNQAEESGGTPLYIASQNGHAEVVKLLLANGADVNKADSEGDTPLFIASHNGHAEVVSSLLKVPGIETIFTLNDFKSFTLNDDVNTMSNHVRMKWPQLRKAAKGGQLKAYGVNGNSASGDIREALRQKNSLQEEDVVTQEKFITSPVRCQPCKHVFDFPSLHKWVVRDNNKCPMCRTTIDCVELMSVAAVTRWNVMKIRFEQAEELEKTTRATVEFKTLVRKQERLREESNKQKQAVEQEEERLRREYEIAKERLAEEKKRSDVAYEQQRRANLEQRDAMLSEARAKQEANKLVNRFHDKLCLTF